MENSNSREYLEKITASVIDNLRNTGPAPSVQLQDVPRKPFGGMTDEEEAELDDLDEDENKDVRMTEHRWDKQIQHDADLEGSDDEEMATANGVTRLGTKKRNFTDFNKTGADTAEASKTGSPKSTNGVSSETAAAATATTDDAHDVNDDTIEDLGASIAQEKETAVSEDTAKEAKKPKVDDDGDVGMTDSAPAEEDTKIKQEEAEPEASKTETAPKESEPAAAQEEAAAPEAKEEAAATAAEPAVEESEPNKTDAEPKDTSPEVATTEKPSESADAMEVDDDKSKEQEKEKEKEKDSETTEKDASS